MASAECEGFGKCLTLRQTRPVLEFQPHPQQAAHQNLRLLGKQSYVLGSRLAYESPITYEVAVPGADHRKRLPGPKRSIPLFEDLVVTLPVGDKLLHVEQLKHPPIQKPATTVRTFFDQTMNLRVNDLHRKHYRQVS